MCCASIAARHALDSLFDIDIIGESGPFGKTRPGEERTGNSHIIKGRAILHLIDLHFTSLHLVTLLPFVEPQSNINNSCCITQSTCVHSSPCSAFSPPSRAPLTPSSAYSTQAPDSHPSTPLSQARCVLSRALQASSRALYKTDAAARVPPRRRTRCVRKAFLFLVLFTADFSRLQPCLTLGPMFLADNALPLRSRPQNRILRCLQF